MHICFLGLGAMGSKMAINLLEAGFSLTVFNRSTEPAEELERRGATRAKTPAMAVAGADLVISMVTDDTASRAVWLGKKKGALIGLRPGVMAVECSTLTLAWTRTLATRLGAIGVPFLDAPVVGTLPHAAAAKLIFLVGGNPETYTKAKPILEKMGSAVHHAGPVGDGMMLKLAVNAMFGIQAATIAELIGMIRRNGMDLEAAFDILAQTPVMSPAGLNIARMMISRTFAPMFPIELVEKDFRYIEESADSVGAHVPVTRTVKGLYRAAAEGGYGADNISGVVQLFD